VKIRLKGGSFQEITRRFGIAVQLVFEKYIKIYFLFFKIYF
jgi:hypothetical protein